MVYVGLNVELHGLKVDDKTLPLLLQDVRTAISSAVQKYKDPDRPDLDGDVEIEIDETAG